MSSVRRIADQAGVSITTVSRALNNDVSVNPKTRERILEIANRSGYVATTGRRVTTNIGFAYTGEQTLGHPYDSAVLEGAARGVSECRFDIVILDLRRDKRAGETYTQFFMRKGVRGVLLRTMADSREVCQVIADEGFPHVVISENYDSPVVNFVGCDSKPDSVRAVEYLTSLGHRRIAFAVHNIPDRDHTDRLEGYKCALEKQGLPFREQLVFKQKYNLAGGATVMNMAMNLKQPPTAIFFADPLLAVGAAKQAHDMGVLIPRDLSIVGFDDTNIRYSVYPTMTAVCQEASALGYEAALYLTRSLKNQTKEGLQKLLPTFLEINESTGPPPR